ncbi:MAG: EAL domain-containing protein [Gallionella sp.]|jgi:diguanylate cyclase (GGDEF)-like protein
MTIKQKIWSIPLITILIFSIGIALVYKSSTYTYDLLQRTEVVHYPYLNQIQTLSAELADIQKAFLDALDANRETGIIRARSNAVEFRQKALDMANIEGKKEISEEILKQFNDYLAAADNAASVLIGIKKGDGVGETGQMIVALNKLTQILHREHLAATLEFEQSLNESRTNVQKMLWVSLLSVFFVLLGLVFVSYRLISSILGSLDHLRTGVSKIAQGDFATRIPERGKDELTQVIQSFNSMSDELQVAIEKRIRYQEELETFNVELENRVISRTAELVLALEEAQKANAAVVYMADHDNLTGLLSRRRFQEEFERWGKYALRYERPMSLMFIDLDKFKTINDTYGHLGGDKYLVGVAEVLKKTLRSTDYIGRWGGDEFAALLPETTAAAACEVAAKLIRVLGTTPISIDDQSLFASASFGIAALPEHTLDVSELTGFADAAMYQAKEAGRGCFSLYSASAQEVQYLSEHTHWAGRIRRALETDQFVLFYQPLLNLTSGEVDEYEALLRMEDQRGEFISPNLFLPSAERFDLGIAIDRMVIKKVVYKIGTFKTLKKTFKLSLNLSTQSLNDSSMIEYIGNIIRESGIDPGNLSIEISETLILQNMERVCNLSAEVTKLGCHLILDDISVGFSSFNYLAPLSIRSIKIHGDLIRNLHIENNREYIVELCKSCQQLNIEVVAKFVDDLSLLDILRDIGVNYAQGFAVGRPLESMDI